MSFNIINSYTAELFPTTLRNSALGVCLMGSRLGAVVAPYIIIWVRMKTAYNALYQAHII